MSLFSSSRVGVQEGVLFVEHLRWYVLPWVRVWVQVRVQGWSRVATVCVATVCAAL